MGGYYSYLKLNCPNGSRTLGIVFEKEGRYKKYVFTVGNGNNIEKEDQYVSYNYYYNYGKWYYYDGRANALDNVLSKYNPKKMDLFEFIADLKAECNIQEYESTFQVIKRWASTAINAIGSLSPIASACYFGAKLLGY